MQGASETRVLASNIRFPEGLPVQMLVHMCLRVYRLLSGAEGTPCFSWGLPLPGVLCSDAEALPKDSGSFNTLELAAYQS